jgi:hypothetical protein
VGAGVSSGAFEKFDVETLPSLREGVETVARLVLEHFEVDRHDRIVVCSNAPLDEIFSVAKGGKAVEFSTSGEAIRAACITEQERGQSQGLARRWRNRNHSRSTNVRFRGNGGTLEVAIEMATRAQMWSTEPESNSGDSWLRMREMRPDSSSRFGRMEIDLSSETVSVCGSVHKASSRRLGSPLVPSYFEPRAANRIALLLMPAYAPRESLEISFFLSWLVAQFWCPWAHCSPTSAPHSAAREKGETHALTSKAKARVDWGAE